MTDGKKLFGKQDELLSKVEGRPRNFTKLPTKLELMQQAFRKLDSLIVRQPEE